MRPELKQLLQTEAEKRYPVGFGPGYLLGNFTSQQFRESMRKAFILGTECHERLTAGNPFHPFASEAEETDYQNRYTDIVCNRLLSHNGVGVFGSDKMQEIAERMAGGIRWVKCSEQKPEPEVEVLFDGGEHGLVYGKYRRSGNVDYVVYKDMDSDDHYEPYSLYERWLDEQPTPDSEVKRLRDELAAMYSLNREGWANSEKYEKQKDKLIEENNRLRELMQKILNTRPATGIVNCKWGDTQYDSVSAAEGYNQCLGNVQAIAREALNQKP